MKILIDICHPAHVHLLKHSINILKEKGHEIFITVKDLPVAKKLMKAEGFSFIEIGSKKDSLFGKALNQIKYNLKVLKIVRKNHIDIGVGSSITLPHVSRVSKMQSIVLDDDDDNVEPLFVKYGHPFANVILTPDSVKRKSNKSIYYPGLHELAYLHPNRFTPDLDVLKEIGLKENDKFFILRFNTFKAHHDIGIEGLTLDQKLKLIEILKPHGKILITTEREIETALKQYQLKVSPEKIHSLMYYATLFIGDSQTMTSEAAVFGVPSLRCNSFAGLISYLEEEEHKYGLTYGFKPEKFNDMEQKLKELLKISDLKAEWKKRRTNLLNDKIDVTSFFVWFIENYPKSKNLIQNAPEFWAQFK